METGTRVRGKTRALLSDRVRIFLLPRGVTMTAAVEDTNILKISCENGVGGGLVTFCQVGGCMPARVSTAVVAGIFNENGNLRDGG